MNKHPSCMHTSNIKRRLRCAAEAEALWRRCASRRQPPEKERRACPVHVRVNPSARVRPTDAHARPAEHFEADNIPTSSRRGGATQATPIHRTDPSPARAGL